MDGNTSGAGVGAGVVSSPFSAVRNDHATAITLCSLCRLSGAVNSANTACSSITVASKMDKEGSWWTISFAYWAMTVLDGLL